MALSGWNQVVVTYTANTPRLYVNGTFQHVGLTSPMTVHPSSVLGDDTGGVYGPFQGSIAIYQVYDRVLSVDEIKRNCLAQEPRFTATPYPGAGICAAP